MPVLALPIHKEEKDSHTDGQPADRAGGWDGGVYICYVTFLLIRFINRVYVDFLQGKQVAGLCR